MSACKTCGREDEGHYIGCVETAHSAESIIFNSPATERACTRESECIVDGCSEPRRSEDKRVKFCETHSDPKNRK